MNESNKKFGLLGQHLGLDAIEASEPEDLPTAQLPLSTVDFLLVLRQLLSFLLTGFQAQPGLLQAWQPLRRHCGNHLQQDRGAADIQMVCL